jgi:GNAT acetyltransferase-like protein
MVSKDDSIEINREVYELNPVLDVRWSEMIKRHPRTSVFHSIGWLNALKNAYGYEPIVYTTIPPGEALTSGLVFCRVKSWLTGRRLVYLPFSDHCEPLVDETSEMHSLLVPAQEELRAGSIKYIDIRPLSLQFSERVDNPESYFIHLLDLRPTLDELYKKLHGDSIRRKIQRAEREHLTLEAGSSEALLKDFYALHVLTRQRQQLPPHPLSWFRQVLLSLGDDARIRVAKKDGRAIASILSLAHKQKMVYKYGCSDAHSHNLGGMQFLFWNLIYTAKEQGFKELDFGRSECDNAGLVTFKDRWGSQRLELRYLRFPPRSAASRNGSSVMINIGKKVFARCPRRVLRLTGNLLYPHAG